MNRLQGKIAPAFLVFVLATGAATRAQAQTGSGTSFTFTTIDVPGARSTAVRGINNTGQIVGNFTDSSSMSHGFLYNAGNFTTIDVLANTVAQGINDSGQIVGFTNNGSGLSFMYSGGVATTVAPVSPPGATPLSNTFLGINNAGQIVGQWAYFPFNGLPQVHGFLDTAGVYTDIAALLGSGYSQAWGVNNAGQIVGYFSCSTGGGFCGDGGFFYNAGVYTIINVPDFTVPGLGSHSTHAQGINDAGQIVGYFFDNGSSHQHGFLDTAGVFTAIDVPAAVNTVISGINNAGVIVGSYQDSAGVTHGFTATRATGPTPAAGYAVASFATGFANAGGVGPAGLALDASGNLYVGDILTGFIHKFGPAGGVASAVTQLNATPFFLGSRPHGLAFGKDGRLYLNLVDIGEVVELDRITGAVIRTVATGVPGASALATDPLSGDLFVSQSGLGSTIFRVSNFANGPGTVTVYATVPFADGLAFGPDGTLYAAAAGLGGVVRIAGTNSPPPTPSTWTFIASVPGADGLAVSATPNTPFLYSNNNGGTITKIDLSTNPPTLTNIMTGGSRGDFATVGPDGCLYVTQTDRVLRVTNADGTCLPPPLGPLFSTSPSIVTTPPQPVAPGTSTTFTSPNVINQTVTIPADANMNGAVMMRVSFIQVSPAVFNASIAAGTNGNAFSGGTPVPPGTTCTPINGAGGNCIITENKCFDANGTAFALCPITAPTTPIQLTSSYKSLTPQPNPALLIASDGQSNYAVITTGFNPADPTISGGTKALNSDEVIANLPGLPPPDTVPPTTTASTSPLAPNGANGWFTTSPVSVILSSTDDQLVKQITYSATGAQTIGNTTVPGASAFFQIANQGVTTISYQATDEAGNVEPLKTLTVKIDTTPPSINITAPTNGAAYTLNQPVAASYACADPESTPAPSCTGPVASGTNIDTASVGGKSFTVNSTDAAGLSSTQSVSYSVSYKICILYDPTHAVASGATIPLKMYLCDFRGNDVSNSGVIVHATKLIQVSTQATDAIVTAGNANPDNDFRFDSTLGPSGGYIFNLMANLTPGVYNLFFTAGNDPSTTHFLAFQVN